MERRWYRKEGSPEGLAEVLNPPSLGLFFLCQPDLD